MKQPKATAATCEAAAERYQKFGYGSPSLKTAPPSWTVVSYAIWRYDIGFESRL